MLNTFSSSAWLWLFTLGSASLIANLLGATVVWGQSVVSSASNSQTSPIEQQTQSSSIPQLHQLDRSSTNAADLLPTCDIDLSKISSTDFKSDCQAQTNSTKDSQDEKSNLLEPTKDRLRINFETKIPMLSPLVLVRELVNLLLYKEEPDAKLFPHQPKDFLLFPLVLIFSKG